MNNISSTFRTWLPALTGMTCLGLGAGLISVFGFFVEPLSREFGVGVATINIGPVALLLVPGFVAPFVGKLVDEQPIRRILLVGATLAMLSLFVVSRAPSLRMAGIAFMFFALGLALYGPVVVNGMLVKLYPGKEARATALAAMGISTASIILPPLVGLLMVHFEWRWALAGLAGGVLLLLWVAILVGTPSKIIPVVSVDTDPIDSRDFYRQPAFWLIGLCIAIGLVGAVVMAICYPSYLISRGFSISQAAWFISLGGVAGLVGKTLVAFAGDALRRQAKWVAAGVLLLQAGAYLLLMDAETSQQVILAACMLGFGGGSFLPMQPYLNSQYFDVRIIGRVNGAQMPLFMPFGLVGPPLAGYVYDQTGSYSWVLIGLIVALGVATLFALLLPSTTINAD